MTMKRDLLAALSRRWVTPIDALMDCHCMSLAQRVSEWRRDGLPIFDKWVESNGKRFKAYKLIKPTKWTA